MRGLEVGTSLASTLQLAYRCAFENRAVANLDASFSEVASALRPERVVFHLLRGCTSGCRSLGLLEGKVMHVMGKGASATRGAP